MEQWVLRKEVLLLDCHSHQTSCHWKLPHGYSCRSCSCYCYCYCYCYCCDCCDPAATAATAAALPRWLAVSSVYFPSSCFFSSSLCHDGRTQQYTFGMLRSSSASLTSGTNALPPDGSRVSFSALRSDPWCGRWRPRSCKIPRYSILQR